MDRKGGSLLPRWIWRWGTKGGHALFGRMANDPAHRQNPLRRFGQCPHHAFGGGVFAGQMQHHGGGLRRRDALGIGAVADGPGRAIAQGQRAFVNRSLPDQAGDLACLSPSPVGDGDGDGCDQLFWGEGNRIGRRIQKDGSMGHREGSLAFPRNDFGLLQNVAGQPRAVGGFELFLGMLQEPEPGPGAVTGQGIAEAQGQVRPANGTAGVVVVGIGAAHEGMQVRPSGKGGWEESRNRISNRTKFPDWPGVSIPREVFVNLRNPQDSQN